MNPNEDFKDYGNQLRQLNSPPNPTNIPTEPQMSTKNFESSADTNTYEINVIEGDPAREAAY